MDVWQFLNSIPSPVWAAAGALGLKGADMAYKVWAASKSPKTPQTWEEGYMDLSKKYLELSANQHILQAQFDGLVASVHQEPYETAQRIIERAKIKT